MIRVFAILLAFVPAFLFTSVFLSHSVFPTRMLWLCRLSLAVGLSLGISSCIFVALLFALNGNHQMAVISEIAIEAGMTLAGIWVFWQRKGDKNRPMHAQAPGEKQRLYSYVFLSILVLSSVLFIMHSINRPHSFDDAYAIWNLRARFLYRAGDNWDVVFSRLLPHSDYPLLIPGSVTRSWAFLGNETTTGPVIVGMLFTFATVFLLTSSVGCFRGQYMGYLAGITLLGITYFTNWGASQWADVPLSFYFLACIMLLSFWKRTSKGGLLFLAGLTGGLAAWTKNEGLLFLLAVLSVYLFLDVTERGLKALPKSLLLFLAGSLLPLLVLAYFKAALAPPNDIISPKAFDSLVGNLADASRHILVLMKVVITPFTELKGRIIFFPILILLLGFRKDASWFAEVRLGFAILFLMLLGYYFVYVISPHDLSWHISTSLGRLYLQLLPLFIFLLFLTLARPDEKFVRME